MTRDKNPHITISDQDPGLPYSKGLMASQVMVTGLSAYRAYEVAETIEVRLLDEGRSSISSLELSQVALEIIGELAGERYATNFTRWQEVQRLDVPLVILIGGAIGVGKSTIATHLAHRLGIVRVVATDGRDPRGDARDAVRRADAGAARLVVPDRYAPSGSRPAAPTRSSPDSESRRLLCRSGSKR